MYNLGNMRSSENYTTATRKEIDRSNEQSEKFQAAEALTRLGMLTKMKDLELYHGRTDDGTPDWHIRADFNNADNATGNRNVNKVPALSTGTRDIALEFASWLSPEFKLYIIKDYQRLKYDENSRLSLSWNLNREVAKLNYRIHTDAIQEHLTVPELTQSQKSFIYANEADMLNVVLFGQTAREWKSENLNKKGNMRDYASIHQLLVLANMESYNAILIGQGISQPERMEKLHDLAARQLNVLDSVNLDDLPQLPDSKKM